MGLCKNCGMPCEMIYDQGRADDPALLALIAERDALQELADVLEEALVEVPDPHYLDWDAIEAARARVREIMGGSDE